MDFNQEATVVASGSYDATVRLWDCRSNSHEPIQILKDAKDSVTSVKVSDYGILTGSVDGFVRDYDIRMGIVRQDEIGRNESTSIHNWVGNESKLSQQQTTIF